MLSRPQKRFVIGAAIFVILVLFVVPAINVNRFRLSVANALTQALGHEVTVQGISLQTFPQPGLLLSGVVVADDPSISAEPMLRAEEVLATLRFTSLWRGRLEISNLKLRYPSLNLVRANDGRWNLESLLERARQAPSAPTANPRPESRTRFPYIESKAGRINLKLGQEKKVFALGEADFALWLASENEWRMRLEARPIRTDANLSDTGTVKVEGSWRRAAQLSDTPVSFRLWWDYGQLGQLTTLIYGRDRGWRGSLRASAIVEGRPDDLKITSDARVEDFRRYDIKSGESVSLHAHCDGFYSLSWRQVRNLYCQSPVGGGTILARGSFGLTPADRNVDLSFSAENVSTQFLAVLLRHIKKDVPEDIKATGRISTAFRVHSNENGDHVWAGNGESSAIEIRSNALTKPLELDSTKWHLIGPGIEQFTANVPPPSKKSNLTRARHEETLPVPDRTAFAFEPVALAIGGASPSTLSGWFSREGYVTELNGEAELTRLVEIGRLLGLPTPAAELSGSAKGTLQIAGTWAGFSLPDYNGNAQLQKVTAKLSGVASPLRIQSARFVADNASLSLTKASVEIEGTHTKLDLDATWPRNCVATQPTEMALCGMRFNVKADQLNIDELNSLVNPKAQKRPWYAAIAISVMGSDRRTFPATYASGQVSTGKLILKSVTATKASADVTITPSGFSIVGLRADTLGGSYVVDLAADFSDGTPAYSSSGNLVNLNIANIAALTHEIFASGKLTGSYKGTAHGWTYDDIVASLSGRADFDWRDGTLPHIELETKGKPLQFKVFKGTAELKNGVVTFPESKLATKSIYAVSGTATLGHELEVKLERKGEPGFSISGSLEHPKVVPVPTSIPETQATLKQTAK